VALELGADFCVRMGASMRVAAAQLRAALRRRDGAGARPGAEASAARPGFAESQDVFDSGAAPVSGVTIDADRRAAVLPDGTEVPLNRAQRETLQLLIAAGGASVSRERISEEVLGRPWSYADRTVDNLVLSLRRRLGLDAEDGPIRAVRNVGYRLVPPRPGG
jgi:DNA-binding response OmpR family regulator